MSEMPAGRSPFGFFPAHLRNRWTLATFFCPFHGRQRIFPVFVSHFSLQFCVKSFVLAFYCKQLREAGCCAATRFLLPDIPVQCSGILLSTEPLNVGTPLSGARDRAERKKVAKGQSVLDRMNK